jgi:hypothetical protein
LDGTDPSRSLLRLPGVALLEMIGAADAGFIFPRKKTSESTGKHRKAPIQTYVPDAVAIISQLKTGLP